MSRWRLGILCAVVVCVARLAFGASESHPYHETYAEVQFDAGVVQVALSVEPVELEAAVSAWAGSRARLDDPGFADQVSGYLDERFVVRDQSGRRSSRIEVLGLEPSGLVCWVYFRAELTDARRVLIENAVLVERNYGQQNFVTAFRRSGVMESAMCDAEYPWAALDVARGAIRTLPMTREATVRVGALLEVSRRIRLALAPVLAVVCATR